MGMISPSGQHARCGTYGGNGMCGHAAEAKQQVPSLVLVNGEDLTPYRQASKRIFSVLARFGTAERLGMDEVNPYVLALHTLLLCCF